MIYSKMSSDLMAAPSLLNQTSNQVLRGIKALFKRVEGGKLGERDTALFSRMSDVVLELLNISKEKLDHKVNELDDNRFETPETGGHANRPPAIQLRADQRDPIQA